MPAAVAAPGTLFAVVGPSGVGKDSVINYARQALLADSRVLFVRRVISRPVDGVGEDHDAVTEAEFNARASQGDFCVTWRAHGLCYGLPAGARSHVLNGGVALANCSRKALASVRDCFPNTQIVEITAAPDVIAQRLAERGRETQADIVARLNRSVDTYHGADAAMAIDNSGPLPVAGDALVQLVAGRVAMPLHANAVSPLVRR